MSTFDGASFKELGTTSALIGGQAVGTHQRIANGGRIWQGPATPASDDSLTIKARATATQYAALRGKLGRSGALAWGIGGTSTTGNTATARLVTISDGQRLKAGDVVTFSLAFVIE